MKTNNSADAEAAPAKCCSGILRRFLLCSGSLPPPPSDHFLDPNPNYVGTKIPHHEFKKPDEAAHFKHAAPPSSPGVVARLMGLDSFPQTPAMMPKSTTLGSLLRSRSVNSIDFLLHFDPAVNKGLLQQQHRRVRTSVSFREGVVNDECISNAVLELEKIDETAPTGYGEEGILVNRKKASVEYQKDKNERKPRSEKVENFQEKRVAKKRAGKRVEMEERKMPNLIVGQKKDFQGKRPVIKPVKSKEEQITLKPCVKNRKNKVMDDRMQPGSNRKKIYPEGSVSELARGVRSRNPLLSKDAFSQESGSVSGSAHDSEVTASIGIREREKNMKAKEGFFIGQMVEEICRATEEDVKENMECAMVFRIEEFEEICQQFGQEIIQVLLKQLVADLVLLYGTRAVNLDSV